MNPTHAPALRPDEQYDLAESITAGQAYAVTYNHEDGPLIGFIGFARDRDEDIVRWWTFEEARTGDLLRVCDDQLCSALAVDGPWMSDAEVTALVG